MEMSARGVITAASFAALVAALVASSGLTSHEASQVLLAFGAIVALTLTRVPRR
jgi:hypothetical protein